MLHYNCSIFRLFCQWRENYLC